MAHLLNVSSSACDCSLLKCFHCLSKPFVPPTSLGLRARLLAVPTLSDERKRTCVAAYRDGAEGRTIHNGVVRHDHVAAMAKRKEKDGEC